MGINIADIKVSERSISYVVIWKKALTTIPPLSTDFFKVVFKSESLDYQFTQQGLQVVLPTIADLNGLTQNQLLIIKPSPQLFIGYERLSYVHTNYDDFFEIYSKVFDEIKYKYSAFHSTLLSAQVGINIEYNLELPDNLSSDKFLNDRFLRSSGSTYGFESAQLADFNLVFTENSANKSKLLQIKVTRSFESQNGLYVHTNDHYGNSPSEHVFTVEQLKKHVEISKNKLFNQVLPYLTEI